MWYLFEESESKLVHVTTKHILDEDASKYVKEAKMIGEKQYQVF